MLKKLRRRFIGAAMAAFTAVVIALVCAVNFVNFRGVAAQQDDALQRLRSAQPLPDDRGAPPLDDWKPFSPEVRYSLRFFTVRFGADGGVTQVNQDFIASVSRSDAEEYARAALASGKTRGYERGYRFLISADGDETVALFLNSERELQSVRALMWVSLGVAGGSLLVVFALVVLFSGRAIAPYLKNLEAQKQFITNASHELKTPLTAISASADVLAMEHGDDEWVQSIQAQTGKLARLVNHLVTLSRLDEENPFPVRAEFSLSDALWELSESFAPLCRARNRRYSQDIADGLTLTGDRTALQQTVSILLDNALKYAPDGGSIALTAQRAGKRTEIAVTNTVDAAQKLDVSRLFERFYRADESRSAAVSGTGIGLSIARATVEAHGGKITARRTGDEIRFQILL